MNREHMSVRSLLKKGASVVKGLHEKDLDPDPFKQFAKWFEDAKRTGMTHPEAMSAATATADGKPATRMVLLKEFDERGFVFYTNYESRKADELAANPRIALLFYWPDRERQVRIEGRIEKVTEEESADYFASRPRGSQIGAWASAQSSIIENREELEALVKKYEDQFKDQDVPLPPFWGGYRCVPDSIEFWQGRYNRLHDRLHYLREGAHWKIVRLSP